ncbi:MAG: hypothetical protein IPH66_18035 [Crocinitomicaceae bacterium]|nr:hypothetical protein [Crocinitomicaceae bacterium]
MSTTLLFSQAPSSGVEYSARDSIVADIPAQIIRLYGDANVTYEDIVLRADFIEIDLVHGEVLATFTLDSAGVPVGKPTFTMGAEESHCDLSSI